MGRLAQTDGLTESEQDILATVRDFTNREIIPVATELEHRDEYPAQIVEGMKKLGLFGLTIGEEYGGLGASLLIYALAVEEIARHPNGGRLLFGLTHEPSQQFPALTLGATIPRAEEWGHNSPR